MLCWHRFDLIDSTYAIALMADRTPAWREVYGRILDELIFRHTGWWAARDWLTQIGHDPDRANYPDLYRLLIPAHLWGDYDVPGWTANGIEPWGLQMDPIGADGNLFFKGFFLVMLGLHLRTTGDERWNDPFDIVRDGENTFTWFHSAIADHLHEQWQRTPDGCHCENTKVWPYCLAGAGLGLQFHDLLRGTNHHEVFTTWWNDVCRTRYLHLDGDELPQAVTLYYDPILDVSHDVPVFAGMVPAIYLAPQEPEGARRLFEAGMRQLGLWEPDGPGRASRSPRVGDRVVVGARVGTRRHRHRARRRDRRAVPAVVRPDHRRVHMGVRARRGTSTRSVQRHDGRGPDRNRGFVVAPRERRTRLAVQRSHRGGRRLPDRSPSTRPGGTPIAKSSRSARSR